MGQIGAIEAEGTVVPAESCRLQLHKILDSADFEATARERRFLSYVVDETLAGRADRIKAYSIAVEVFGRDASFDPQNDPIVRIEAGHLRRSLERYYLLGGQNDPVLISIPKGGYVPTFTSAPGRPAAETATLAEPVASVSLGTRARRKIEWAAATATGVIVLVIFAILAFKFDAFGARPAAPEIPRIAVARFDDLTQTGSSAAITSGLTQEVIGQLAKFRDIVVVESLETAAASGTTPRYALLGSVSLSEDAFRLRVRFVNRSDRSVLWANTYDGGLKVATLLEAQADIAQNVATSLAQTYGVVFQADAAIDDVDAPDDWAAYSCTLAYYDYRVRVDRTALPKVKACLEAAVERFPTYATALALLAQTYIDEIRYIFPYQAATSAAAIDRALIMARKAVALDPLNIRAMQAEMFALSFNREFDAARAVGERALAINPNDTELLGEFGYRLSLAGHWKEGCAMLLQATERGAGPSAYYESGLALCAFFGRDNAQAVKWIKKTPTPANPLYHLIAAAIFGEAGNTADAFAHREWLERNEPALVAQLRQEVSVRLGRAEDIEFVLYALGKAGFRQDPS